MHEHIEGLYAAVNEADGDPSTFLIIPINRGIVEWGRHL